ncbi:MAG: hypothetical protein ABFE07_23705 [Armatimonadia bacterium]
MGFAKWTLLLVVSLSAAAFAAPADLPGYLPVFEKPAAWSAGSNYAYHQKPGVNLKAEVGPASPSEHPSLKVTFVGPGLAPKPYERDIYLSLPTRIERRPKTITMAVWGDAMQETLEFHLRDAKGETIVWRTTVDWKGWKQLEFDGAKPGGSWGGDADNQKGLVDLPIVRFAIDIMEGKGATPGPRELAFADLCLTEETAAPGEDPRPALGVGPTSTPPTVDGSLDDPCYTRAARVTELLPSSGSPYQSPHPADVFVTYDAANWYVAFHCYDDPGHQLTVQKRPRDGAVWEDDSIELMIAPPGDRPPFHHLIINALGDIYDERWTRDAQGEGGRWDGTWNAAGLKAVARPDEQKGGYYIELALPFADVGGATPATGQPWRMNFCRMRRMEGGRNAASEASSWGGSQHFQGLDTPGVVWPAVAPLRLEFAPLTWQVGTNALAARLISPDQSARKVRVEVQTYDRNMRPRAQSQELAVPAGQPATLSLPVELTTDDDGGHVRVQAYDLPSGVMLYRNLVKPIAVKHLFELETDAVAYGPEQDFCLERVHLNLPPEALVTSKLAVTWTRRATGKQVYRQVFDYFYADPMCVAVSLSFMPPGVYDLDAALTGAGDKVLERRQWAITRLPEREHKLTPVTRVDLGPNRELRVNGKPFFGLSVHHVRPEEYPTLKRYGFNAVPVWVGPSKDAATSLDRAWQAGLYSELGLCDLGYNWEGFYRDPEGSRQRMRDKVRLNRTHPGLFTYHLGDELANDKLDDFVPLYQEVKRLDPNHLKSMSTGPCWLSADQIRKRATVSDVVSPDLYNVGRGPLTEHPRLCDIYREALASVPGKTLTKVPQVTGYSTVGYRLPTPEELRYMCYADIVHGAKGFSYYKWGAHSSDPGAETGMRHDYRLMSAVRQLNWEITDLSDAILAGQPATVTRRDDCGKDIELWCREVDGRKYLWALNNSNLPAKASAALPGLSGGEGVEVFYEDRQVKTASGGVLSEELPPYGVKIYVWPGTATFAE